MQSLGNESPKHLASFSSPRIAMPPMGYGMRSMLTNDACPGKADPNVVPCQTGHETQTIWFQDLNDMTNGCSTLLDIEGSKRLAYALPSPCRA